MNTYKSIDPEQMSSSEIRNLCADLLTAKNWNQNSVEVKLETGERKVILVNKLSDYQSHHKIEIGNINLNRGK